MIMMFVKYVFVVTPEVVSQSVSQPKRKPPPKLRGCMKYKFRPSQFRIGRYSGSKVFEGGSGTILTVKLVVGLAESPNYKMHPHVCATVL